MLPNDKMWKFKNIRAILRFETVTLQFCTIMTMMLKKCRDDANGGECDADDADDADDRLSSIM